MNVQVLQKVDRWLGVPLCCALSLAHKVLGPFRSPAADPPRNLLVVKLAEQGSTVLAYPALYRAVEMVGRGNVYFLAFEENRFILDMLNVIPRENVITISVKNPAVFLWSVLLAIRRLHSRKFDAAVDFEFFSRGSAALALLSGAKRRAGFHSFFGDGPYRGNLMTHRLIYNPHLHTSQTFLTLIEALLCNPTSLPTFSANFGALSASSPQLVIDPDEVPTVRELVQPNGTPCRPLILLNANASDLLPLRRWPGERYVELARRLLNKYPQIQVGFTGGRNEASKTSELVQQVGSDRCISLAGKTTLRQLLVLYTLAEVLVTNDSGPAHFATLTSIDVVTLFGPETPKLFAALTPRNTVLWAGLACSPCVSAYNNRMSPCRDNQCMQAITVDQVFTTVCRVFEQRRNLRVNEESRAI